MIREKFLNQQKSRNLDKLVLITEAEKTILRNSGVINVYTFSHSDFGGVDF